MRLHVPGRFGSYRFENHPTCDYTSAIEIHHRGRSTEFERSLYASEYGMLLVGSRAYFAELAYGRWRLVPVFSDPSDVPVVVRPATGTSFDSDYIETEVWVCAPAPSLE